MSTRHKRLHVWSRSDWKSWKQSYSPETSRVCYRCEMEAYIVQMKPRIFMVRQLIDVLEGEDEWHEINALPSCVMTDLIGPIHHNRYLTRLYTCECDLRRAYQEAYEKTMEVLVSSKPGLAKVVAKEVDPIRVAAENVYRGRHKILAEVLDKSKKSI